MGEDIRSGQTAVFMKDTGSTTKQMVVVDLSMLTETSTMATGKMTKPMDTANTLIQMVLSIAAIGWTTNSMVKETNNGQTAPNTQEATRLERRTARVSSCGLTNPPTMETSLITTSMAKANTDGLTEESTRETGFPTRCMELECSLGLMAESMNENTSTIRSKVTEFSPGQMADNTTASGSTESKRALEFTITQEER